MFVKLAGWTSICSTSTMMGLLGSGNNERCIMQNTPQSRKMFPTPTHKS